MHNKDKWYAYKMVYIIIINVYKDTHRTWRHYSYLLTHPSEAFPLVGPFPLALMVDSLEVQ